MPPMFKPMRHDDCVKTSIFVSEKERNHVDQASGMAKSLDHPEGGSYLTSDCARWLTFEAARPHRKSGRAAA